MFPHTVTLYNVERVLGPGGREDRINHITVLEGVLLAEEQGASARKGGPDAADSATAYIPYTVKATDGVTGAAKAYVPPKAFAAAEDKSGLWTLEPGEGCFFVRGTVVETEMSFQQLLAGYDGVYRLRRCAQRDYSAAGLEHWEAGGA